MRSEMEDFYRDEAERIRKRHAGIDPDADNTPKSVPFSRGPCPDCGRVADLCSTSKCVQCHYRSVTNWTPRRTYN